MDTAYHKDVPFWSPDNSSAGQCAITALVVQRYIGGIILGGSSGDSIFHFWNKVGQCTIDLTAEQFTHPPLFFNVVVWEPESLLETGDVKKDIKSYSVEFQVV